MIISFTHEAEPTAWARARQSGHRYFTSPKVARAKSALAFLAKEQMKGVTLIAGPARLTCDFFFMMPASWSRKKRSEGVFHTSKPDLDNLVKLVKDALTGIVWIDDAQVRSIDASKYWDLNGGKSIISVETIG